MVDVIVLFWGNRQVSSITGQRASLCDVRGYLTEEVVKVLGNNLMEREEGFMYWPAV